MSNWIIYSIGFAAQLFFGARLVTQWVLSEKAKKVQTPAIFWKYSLLAAILMFIYGYFRQDLAIMIGQILIYVVYIRNLQLQDKWSNSNTILKAVVVVFPLLIAVYLIFVSKVELRDLVRGENISTTLVGYGILAQVIFNTRFIYQWAYSEKKKESSLPLGFWIISLTGASMIFVYGIFRKDPVLIASHLFGGFVYVRNLLLLKEPVLE